MRNMSLIEKICRVEVIFMFFSETSLKQCRVIMYSVLLCCTLFLILQGPFLFIQSAHAEDKKPKVTFGVEKIEGELARKEELPKTFFDYYWHAGFMMHFILLDSIVGLAIFLEKLLVLRRGKIIPTVFVQTIKQNLKMKGNNWTYKDVYQFINSSPEKDSCFARVLKAGLRLHKEGVPGMKAAIENANLLEGRAFDKRVSMLGLLANIAPLLGFLGTVTGMIKAFEAMARMASTSPAIVGGGISEALITTAFGLFVGIPLLVCYYNIKGIVEGILGDIDENAVEIIELVACKGEDGFDEI